MEVPRINLVRAFERTSSWGLINGGLAGTIWIYLVGVLGFGAVILSMAEMASMVSPKAQALYHPFNARRRCFPLKKDEN